MLWKRNDRDKLHSSDRDSVTPISTGDLEKIAEMSIRLIIFSKGIQIEESVWKDGSILSAGLAVSALMNGLQSVLMMKSW